MSGAHRSGAATAVLSLLTDAAQALDAARDLAAAAGMTLTEQVVQRAGVFVASSIDTVTQPISLGGVLQPPVRTEGAR